jgi:hypothetical protein
VGNVTIYDQGAGSFGVFTVSPSNNLPGGAGGRAIKAAAVTPGATFAVLVGATNGITGANGQNSTVSGTGVSLVAYGGQGNGSASTLPTGGDTNVQGGAASGTTGGVSPDGTYGNGRSTSPTVPAAGGRVTFVYAA